MDPGQSKRWGALAAAGGTAVVVLLLLAVVLSQEATRPAPPPSHPSLTPPADPPVALVNGEPIGQNFWAEAALVDQVMSGLAGVPAPSPEETLDRLINEVLVLQAVPSYETPPEAEVEAQIAALEAAWGVTDEQAASALEAVGLGREALVRTVARLLTVQQAQGALEAEGHRIEDWLARQRGQAQIVIYQERVAALPLLSSLPSPFPLPSPTPEPALPLAPDFTLERVGGGSFTLSEQLTEGPVVLVFFNRCG